MELDIATVLHLTVLPDLDDDDDNSDNMTSVGIIYNAFVKSGIGGENPKTLKEAK